MLCWVGIYINNHQRLTELNNNKNNKKTVTLTGALLAYIKGGNKYLYSVQKGFINFVLLIW